MHTPDSRPAVTSPLLYQARFDSRSGDLVGMQALVAGSPHPEVQLLVSGSDIELDTLRGACQQLAAWQDSTGRPLGLALGARLEPLCEPGLAHALGAILLETRLAPRSLEISIITTRDEVPDDMLAALSQLHRLGVRFAICATSPASTRVAWTAQLPIDSIEVPASLVQNVAAAPEGVAIVRALLTRAHRMGRQVCATDIASHQASTVMTAAGADTLQGPLMAAPLPADDFSALLASGHRLDAALLRGPATERTLLLVDDEDNILSALRRLLRRDGYTILTASDGKQGLEVLAANQVDVIVSDQRMPGMTGVEFLRKAKDMCPDSVRLVLSGYTDLQSVTDAINEGAIYKFLTKPWDDAMLRANIEEAFRRKALSDENQRLTNELQHANQELARINARLENLLAAQQHRLGVDEAALTLAQEALAVMPLPLLGIDPDGMIAFANQAAEHLFADLAPLMGMSADEVLPPPLAALSGSVKGHCEALFDGVHFCVEARPLGSNGPHRGTLLSFTCRNPA
jgi:EAL domain-containing protein (putative c-di-GMP-specific phosphodiesterase class I)/FixJ family two-component response regulator